MMTDAQKILLQELTARCAEAGTNEFEYSLEYWGSPLWTPWYIYVAGKEINISLTHMDYSYFTELARLGEIEILKEFEQQELKSDELQRTRFRINTLINESNIR